MQRIVSILLILCLTLQICSKLSIIASYQLNKDFIASVLCLKKEEPRSGCEGKCYLNKQLAQAEQHEHSPAGSFKFKAEVLFIQQINIFSFATPFTNVSTLILYLQPFYTSPTFTVFTPPKV